MEKTWDGLWKPVYPNFAIDSWDAQFRKPRSCNHWKNHRPGYVVKHLGGKFLHRDTPVLRVEDLGTHTQHTTDPLRRDSGTMDSVPQESWPFYSNPRVNGFHRISVIFVF